MRKQLRSALIFILVITFCLGCFFPALGEGEGLYPEDFSTEQATRITDDIFTEAAIDGKVFEFAHTLIQENSASLYSFFTLPLKKAKLLDVEKDSIQSFAALQQNAVISELTFCLSYELEEERQIAFTFPDRLMDECEEYHLYRIDEYGEVEEIKYREMLPENIPAEDAAPLLKLKKGVYVLARLVQDNTQAPKKRSMAKGAAYSADRADTAEDDAAESPSADVTEYRKTKTVTTTDGERYHIILTYGPDTLISEDAILQVSEIKKSEAAYDDYVSEAGRLLDCEDTSRLSARLFDITLSDSEGNHLQPADGTTVKVDISMTEDVSDQLSVVHLSDAPEVLNVQTGSKTIRFETGGFSVYALIDVIDHTTPQKYTGTDPDGMTLYISNKRGSTEYYLLDTINTRSGKSHFMNHTSDVNQAVPYTFTRIKEGENAGKYTIETLVNGVTKYLTLTPPPTPTNGKLSLEDTPYYFTLSKQNDIWLIQAGDGTNNYLNHNDSDGFTRWKDGYSDAGNRILLSTMAVENDPFEIDGKTYPLILFKNNVRAALMSESGPQTGRLAAAELSDRLDPINIGEYIYYTDEDVSEWTFRWIEGHNYYVLSEDGKYLTITPGTGSDANLELLDTPNANSVITITEGTRNLAGKIRLANSSGYAVNLNNGTAKNGFCGYKGTSPNDTNEFFNLGVDTIYPDQDLVVFSAHKVSISDTEKVVGKDPDKSKLVIYTRVWNSNTKSYDFYALDHAGNMIKAYSNGDKIEVSGLTVENMLWEFTEYFYDDGITPNYYYELQNLYSGKYLAPQLSGQMFSDNPIGINLNGRRYGDNHSSILAWDDPYYAYAGYAIENNHLVPATMAHSVQFYFAIYDDPEEEEALTTVKTIDNNDYGISMKMIDYENRKQNIYDTFQTLIMGEGSKGDKGTKGLVTPYLVDYGNDLKYPISTETQESLAKLFAAADTTGYSNTVMDVNHLFLEGTYNESGYFEFNSTKNFAHLDTDPNSENYGNFIVYDQVGTIDKPGGKSLDHGQFMPYNDLVGASISTLFKNNTDELDNLLPPDDPRRGMDLYGLAYNSNNQTLPYAHYHFGMELDAAFVQTSDGLDDWGNDMIFEFSGDDDMWLYIDDLLVLDLGGTHPAYSGTINFKTGAVQYNDNSKSTFITSDLLEIFRSSYTEKYKAEHSGLDPTDPEDAAAISAAVEAWLATIFKPDPENPGQLLPVFKNYTAHSMKMLYMERGAGASNLHLRFNLASVKPGQVVLEKELDLGGEETSEDYLLTRFPFQIYYKTPGDTDFQLLAYDDEDVRVKYLHTQTPVDHEEHYTPPGSVGLTYDNVFFLKPGQQVTIDVPDETIQYYIVECGIDNTIYDKVDVNGEVVSPSYVPGHSDRSDFGIDPASVEERSMVVYTNKVDSEEGEEALRHLIITKKLFAEDGETVLNYNDDPTTFTYRLYLSDEQSETTIKTDDTSIIWEATDAGNGEITLSNSSSYLGTTDNTTLDLSSSDTDGRWTVVNGIPVIGPNNGTIIWDAASPGDFALGNPSDSQTTHKVYYFVEADSSETASAGNEKTFIVASDIVAGKKYLIVNDYVTGEAAALGNNGTLSTTNVSINETPISDAKSPELVNMGPYCVLDPDGNYCKWDVGEQNFVSLGKADYGQLDGNEKELATFYTSPNGSISRIPAGYSVEVRDLLAKMEFIVEERPSDMPKGYRWVEYEREEGSYDVIDGTINHGKIRRGSNAKIDVDNKRVYSLTADKIWTDADFTEWHENIYFAVYRVNPLDDTETLVSDTVRRLTSPAVTTEYEFDDVDDIIQGSNFSEYVVREVLVENPTVDTDGKVTGYTSLTPIDGGGSTPFYARDNGSQSEVQHDYIVTYSQGTAYGTNDNIREDTVTNTRDAANDSIRIIKKDFSGSPLADAEFTLKDQNGAAVGSSASYTSDASGDVITAYLADGDYTLSEIRSPSGHRGLSSDMIIRKTTEGGNTSYTFLKPDGTTPYSDLEYAFVWPVGDMPTLTLKDRPFTLTVVNKDRDSQDLLDNIHYSLYAGVSGSSTGHDYLPLEGFEDEVSDNNGILEDIDEELTRRTYFLVETQPHNGYSFIPGDVIFSISDTGEVILDPDERDPDQNHYSLTWEEDQDGTLNYTITILHDLQGSVSVTKTVTGNMGSRDKEFDFIITFSGNHLIELPRNLPYTITDGTGAVVKSGTLYLSNDTSSMSASFKLTHDQTILFDNLPAGMTYAVTEADYSDIGYTTTSTSASGTVPGGTAAEAQFTNNRNILVPTKVEYNFTLMAFALAGAAIGLTIFLILRRKRR